MSQVEIPFIGGAYLGRSKDLNAQLCQNFYLEVDQTGAKNLIALIGCPGMKLWLDTEADGEVRGFEIHMGHLYAVIGNIVFRIGTDKSYTNMGTIGTTTGWVDMTSDGVYLMIVDSTGGWTCDGATLSTISDLDFPLVSGATYQDGYHIISRAGTDEIRICEQDNPTSWDPTDIAYAEGAGDPLVSPISVDRQLWLIGEQTTEIWYNAGETFPFARNPGGFITTGCNSKRSIASLQGELMWLDNHNRIVRKNGLQLATASTYQIEYLISTFVQTYDAVAFMYFQEGHLFYEITFPGAEKTLCYDLTTGFWHTRASGDADLRSRANCAIRFANAVLVGDFASGRILEYDLATYTDDGDVKRAIRAAQAVNNSNQITFYNSFELEMETGVGDDVTLDPQIAFQYSKDAGHTWSPERWRSIGAIGAYHQRLRYRRLGKGRDFVPKITISDPVKRNIFKAYLDGTVTGA